MFAGKKSAQIREILISESAWEEMTCLFAPSLVVICFTILLLTWMVRDSLCELQIRQGNIELVAFLACDIKQ
ncbi:hypothetical protein KAM260_01690 [Klebsiella pneumoniae]|nr:hypothetical protein KAM260_01690 [Klebsiella pneumoniae]